MLDTLRHHKLLIAVVVFGLASLVGFTWGVYIDYVDRAAEHHEHAVFWSTSFAATWLYNATSNWQSEALVGILLVVLLKRKGEEPA